MIQHITQLLRNTYFKIYEIYEIDMKSICILQLQRNTYFEIYEIYRESIYILGTWTPWRAEKEQEREREEMCTPQESRWH